MYIGLLCKGGPETSQDVLNNFVKQFLFCAHFGYKVVTRKNFYYKGTFYAPFMQHKNWVDLYSIAL